MRMRTILLGLAVLICGGAHNAWATEGTTYRGMFGPRTLGGPVTPRAGTRFDRGVQRGPSGEFLGLSRSLRYGPAPPVLRSAIPETLQPRTVLPPVRPPSAIPARPYPAEVPMRVGPRSIPEPAPPADIWFRARQPRGR
jgi:hypothetical protein